jgi:hypothetical protein
MMDNELKKVENLQSWNPTKFKTDIKKFREYGEKFGYSSQGVTGETKSTAM